MILHRFSPSFIRSLRPYRPYVQILEVGPRDGLQNETKCLSIPKKIEFIRKIHNTGIRSIEAGSLVNFSKVPQMSGTHEVINNLSDISKTTSISVLVPSKNQLKNLPENVNEIVLFVSTSNTFNQKNINTDVQGAFKRFIEIVDELQEIKRLRGKDIYIRGSISCCWSCPFEGTTDFVNLLDIVRRYEAIGADSIDICDTIGTATPSSTYKLLKDVIKNTFLPVSLHLHDTNGFGVENTLVGVEMGIRSVQGSIAGIGGCPFSPNRAGNVDTVSLVEALEQRGYSTNIDLEKLKECKSWIIDQLKN